MPTLRSQVKLSLSTALLAAVAVLGAFAANPASAAPRSLTTGLSGLYDFGPEALQQTTDTGSQFVRVVISWKAIAPVARPEGWNPADPADPAYEWHQTDEAIRSIVGAGLTPFALVTEAPAWAERCQVENLPAAVCDPDPEAFATFARAAALRYNGNFGDLPAVRYWQPINEPNLSLFFNPQFVGGKPASPDLYRKILNGFYASVNGVNAENQVVGGGLGPIAVPKYTIGPMEFTRRLLCMTGGNRNPHRAKGSCEGGVHFDIFDIHPYTTGGPTHKGGANDVQMGDLGKLQKLLRAGKKAKRIVGRFAATPLWITEFSWDSNPPDPGGLPMRIEKRWVPEAMYRAWKAGVSHFFWYSLRDDPITPGVPASASLQSGLYFRGETIAQDRPKPYMHAFRFPFVAYPGHRLSYWGMNPAKTGAKVVIEARDGGRWRRIAVVRASAAGIFRGTVSTHYGRDLRGSVRAKIGTTASVPFSMRPVKDFLQPPFG